MDATVFDILEDEDKNKWFRKPWGFGAIFGFWSYFFGAIIFGDLLCFVMHKGNKLSMLLCTLCQIYFLMFERNNLFISRCERNIISLANSIVTD